MHKFFKFCANVINYRNVIKFSHPPFSPLNISHAKCCSTITNKKGKSLKPVSINFDEMIRTRRIEAQQSILVQVNSEKSYTELYTYCSQFGHIIGAHHYTQADSHYVLLEYSSSNEAEAAIMSSTTNEDISDIVVQSPFLWFRAGPRQKVNQTKKPPTPPSPTIKPGILTIVDGNRIPDENDVNGWLRVVETIDDQMDILHRTTCLNDIGIRLRFMAARQLEQALIGMFPSVQAYPFGSSVNGFGKLGCDLDLILRLTSKKVDKTSRLVFHTKENLTNGRSQTQRQMESVSDILQLFLPGICHVRRILQARVPIIKYTHEHLDLEVDLSMNNLTGVYMSELLYMLGQIDARVIPLVFSIRRWAQAVGLTNPSPGRWISNFSLTCLVIFYLQQLKQPILPSINVLMKQAQPRDTYITEEGVNCTFLRDLKKLQFKITNTSSAAALLSEFFEFYSQMDFSERALSLNDGCAILKPDHSPMYIVNPLEIQLNVSKNISAEECERFRIEVRNAAWILDTFADGAANSQEWGLLGLMKDNKQNAVIRPNMFFKPRLVDVSELFDDEKKHPKTLQRLEPFENDNVHQQIEFKNVAVKNEVQEIRKKTKSDIQKINTGKILNVPANRIRKR